MRACTHYLQIVLRRLYLATEEERIEVVEKDVVAQLLVRKQQHDLSLATDSCVAAASVACRWAGVGRRWPALVGGWVGQEESIDLPLLKNDRAEDTFHLLEKVRSRVRPAHLRRNQRVLEHHRCELRDRALTCAKGS